MRRSKYEKSYIGGYGTEKPGVVTLCLCLYFIMMPFDSFSLFGIGSLLRIVALLPLGAIFFLERDKMFYADNLAKILLFYVLFIGLTCIWSLHPNHSFRYYRRLILNMAVIFGVGSMRYDYNDREIAWLKMSLVIGGLATMLFTFIFADYSAGGRLTLSVNGVNQDQNYLNGYMFFAFVYFLSRLLKKRKLVNMIPLGAMFFFTLLTGSRGALVALIGITCVTVFYILGQEGRLNLQTMIVILMLLLLLIINYDWILSLLPASIGQRFSLSYIAKHGSTGRTMIWRTLLRKYYEAPLFREFLGYGYSMTPILNTYNHLAAHNLFLEHLIMSGGLGLLIFGVMQIMFFRAAWKTGDVFLIGSYVGFLIMMMTLSLLTYKPIWNCMMMIMILQRHGHRQEEGEVAVYA